MATKEKQASPQASPKGLNPAAAEFKKSLSAAAEPWEPPKNRGQSGGKGGGGRRRNRHSGQQQQQNLMQQQWLMMQQQQQLMTMQMVSNMQKQQIQQMVVQQGSLAAGEPPPERLRLPDGTVLMMADPAQRDAARQRSATAAEKLKGLTTAAPGPAAPRDPGADLLRSAIGLRKKH